MKQSLMTIFLIATVSVVSPISAADAEVNDHLKCRRIEAGTKIKTKVKIEGLDARYSARRCRVHRARLLCSTTARVGMDPSPELEFVDGDAIADDYVCYNTKCKKRPASDVATDAFGTRRIGKLRSKRLCVPTESPEPAA